MFERTIVFVLTILLLSAACFGQTAPRARDSVQAKYEQQLKQAAADATERIKNLEEQIATAPVSEQDALEKQVADVKRDGEIRRLEILLDWAREENDAVHIAEIEQALANWRNPPQTQALPQLPKDATSAAQAAPPEKPHDNSNPASK